LNEGFLKKVPKIQIKGKFNNYYNKDYKKKEENQVECEKDL